MSLTPEQIAARAGKITASFVPYLMRGDQERIVEEWMRLTEHPEYEPPDFSDAEWRYLFGNAVEPLALDWHERKIGQPLIRRGEVVTHPDLLHVCCTLDAYRESDRCVIDCKAWSSWQKIDYICSFLAPQVIVQRGCVGADSMALLIVHGGTEPVEHPIEVSPEYEAEVWAKVAEFWQCVLDLRPPYEIKASAPAVVEAFREVDMTGNNAWASLARDWDDNRRAAKAFQIADKEIKTLVPADAKRAFGHGISVSRSKAGALTIKEG